MSDPEYKALQERIQELEADLKTCDSARQAALTMRDSWHNTWQDTNYKLRQAQHENDEAREALGHYIGVTSDYDLKEFVWRLGEKLEQAEKQASDWNELRPEVQAFALEMERVLKLNDYKGGWEDCTPNMLLGRLIQETGELIASMKGESNGNGFAAMMLFSQLHNLGRYILKDNRNDFGLVFTAPEYSQWEVNAHKHEAVDVANFAMMIHDRMTKEEHSLAKEKVAGSNPES